MGQCVPSRQAAAPVPTPRNELPDDVPDFDEIYGVGVIPSMGGHQAPTTLSQRGGKRRASRSEGSFGTYSGTDDSDGLTPRFEGLRNNSDYESTPRDVANHRDKWSDVRRQNLPQVDAAVRAGRIGRYTQFNLDGGIPNGHKGLGVAPSQEYMCGVQERLAAKMAASRGGTKAGTGRTPGPGGRRSDPGPRPTLHNNAKAGSRRGRVPKISFSDVELHYFVCTQHEGTAQPKSGGPGISMGTKEIGHATYKLSEFEKLRNGKRTPRQKFHKGGRLSVADRIKILDGCRNSVTAR